MNGPSRLKITLYLSAIFLAGAVTGALILSIAWRHFMFGPPHPDKMAARWCGELQTELNLTPEQVQKIRPIVNDTMDEVRTSITHQLSTTISNCNTRIAAELTPEQQVKFQKLIKEREEMMRQKFGEKASDTPKSQ
jgi:Spy/CpxP family protein refolding chaperone